jgi:hypothetical protein
MPSQRRQPTDTRQVWNRLERRLLAAVLVSLVVVGSLLTGIIFGWPSALTGLLCLLPGALVILLLWLLLRGIEYLVTDR